MMPVLEETEIILETVARYARQELKKVIRFADDGTEDLALARTILGAWARV